MGKSIWHSIEAMAFNCNDAKQHKIEFHLSFSTTKLRIGLRIVTNVILCKSHATAFGHNWIDIWPKQEKKIQNSSMCLHIGFYFDRNQKNHRRSHCKILCSILVMIDSCCLRKYTAIKMMLLSIVDGRILYLLNDTDQANEEESDRERERATDARTQHTCLCASRAMQFNP